MYKINILISTTTNWNQGDNFICFGVKNILKHIFPITPNYIHYDRNPNNMINWPHDQNMKAGLHGTFMNNPIAWDKIDLVVLAGSPEFLHEPLKPIYEGLYKHPEIPMIAIGVGYTFPQFLKPLSNEEIKVLSRENTLIITRQRELSNRLELVIDKKITELPCPALFCFEDFPEKTKEELNTDDAYLNTDPYDVLKLIGQHKRIITNKLHGTIAGVSSGCRITLNNSDFRVVEAIKLFDGYLDAAPEDIFDFKQRTFYNYITHINNFLCSITFPKMTQEPILSM